MFHKNKGFTMIELMVLIGSCCLLLIFVPSCNVGSNYMAAKEKAKEVETKANLHTIQIAVERFATDHEGQYPKQLFGGDSRGWSTKIVDGIPSGCLALQKPEDNDAWEAPPTDPLIEQNYLVSYPENPFMELGKGGNPMLLFTGGTDQAGYGDPRFGYRGNIMGNCLNDPRYLWERRDGNLVLTSEKNMIYNWEGTRKSGVAMVNPGRDFNPLYMGGLTGLPGQFFYRSAGEFFYPEGLKGDSTIWDLPYLRINRYILGCYGGIRTKGKDVYRLTGLDGQPGNNATGYLDDLYRTSRIVADEYKSRTFLWEGVRFHLSTPEVFGGGDHETAPFFPYLNDDKEWIYGAPDGIMDGVILTLTSATPD